MVFCGPVETVSGYGSHARDLVLSLIKMDKFEIKIFPINWGDTPMNALDENNTEHFEILSRISKESISVKPDIWIQCTIPTEFNPIGKYNIGITAGIETDVCSPEWVEGCNKMDLILVPSNHAKDIFIQTAYEKKNKLTGETIGTVKINKPIEVLHEGVRTDIYNKNKKPTESVSEKLNTIKEDFCFLFVGHWLKGDFGEDRKDISGLIYTFLKTFKDTKNPPALILKTSMGTFSRTSKTEIVKKITSIKQMVDGKKLPNIYLLYGDLNEDEMNTLYNHKKVKAFVSFTKGEGYGRPIAEFLTTGKPVIVSGWSGHLDFVNPNGNILLPGQLKPVHDSSVWETVINKGSKWFSVDYTIASNKLLDVHSKYNNYLSKSKVSIWDMRNTWSYDKMSEKFNNILNKRLPKFAERITMTLPKIKKASEVK
jgi:glycosyltransferase involved in cell wall biosynthesis